MAVVASDIRLAMSRSTADGWLSIVEQTHRAMETQMVVHHSRHHIRHLRFEPCQSLLLRFDQKGSFDQIDIAYSPS